MGAAGSVIDLDNCDLKEFFSRYDKDHLGRVNLEEWKWILSELGLIQGGEVEEIFASIDSSERGLVSIMDLKRSYPTQVNQIAFKWMELQLKKKDATISSLTRKVGDLEKDAELLHETVSSSNPIDSANLDVKPVFIVHAEADIVFAERLMAEMVARGLGDKVNSLSIGEAQRSQIVAKCSAAVLVFSPAFFESRRCVVETKLIARRIERKQAVSFFLCNSEPAQLSVEVAYTLGGDSGQRIMFFDPSRSFSEHAENLINPIKRFLEGGSAVSEDVTKDFFVSYAVKTKEIVWPAADHLDSITRGNVWIDHNMIVAGADWDSQISAALFNARVGVIFVSSPFFESTNCKKEVTLFARRIERKEDLQLFVVNLDGSEIPVKLRYALGEVQKVYSLNNETDVRKVLDDILQRSQATKNEESRKKLTDEELRGFNSLGTLSHNSSKSSIVCLVSTNEWVISGSWDHTVKIWDAATLREVSHLKGHNGRIRAIQVIGLGARTFLATAAGGAGGPNDPDVLIWDLATFSVVSVLRGHHIGVMGLAYSEGVLFTGGMDSKVFAWQLPDPLVQGTEWARLYEISIPTVASKQKETSAAGLAVSNGRIFVACWNDDPAFSLIRVYDLQSHEEVGAISHHKPYPRSVAVDPQTGHIFSTGKDGTALEFTADTLETVFVFRGHTDGVQNVFVGHGSLSNYLVTCGNDCTLRLWNRQSKACVRVLKNRNYFVNACTLTQGKAFAASGDGLVVVYGMENSALL